MKKTLAFLLTVLMVMSLCACGASATKDTYAYSAAAVPQAAPAEAEYYRDEVYEEAGYMPEPAAAVNGLGGDAGLSAAAGSSSGDIQVDKLIYSADVTVETRDFDASTAALSALLERMGGFIESSSLSGSSARGSSRYANYCLRIPSRYFQEVMGSLSELGNILYTNTYTDNITSQYYDTQARLTAYQTQEATLLSMLEKAENVDDLIAIEDKLTDVRYHIESIQSTLKNWDRQVSYSTVRLSLEEVREYTPEPDPGFGTRIATAFRDGWEGFVEFLQDFAVWFVGALPALILAALVIWGLVALIRGRKRRKARKLAKRYEDAMSEKDVPSDK